MTTAVANIASQAIYKSKHSATTLSDPQYLNCNADGYVLNSKGTAFPAVTPESEAGADGAPRPTESDTGSILTRPGRTRRGGGRNMRTK